MNTMTIQWKSSAICCVASVVAQTEDSATSAPTDRSMPPPMITNVMPMLTTPMTDASRRIVRTLSMSANRSPAVMTPTMHRIARAMTRPRLRPTGSGQEATARSAVGRLARAVVELPPVVTVALSLMPRPLRAAVRAPVCGVPSMIRSSTRCSSSASAGASETTAPSAITSTRSARPKHLGDLAGDHDDGDTAVGEVADQRVDLRPRPDVDTAGRLVEEQDLAVAEQPAGQDDLLLVAAGEGARDPGHVGRPDVERLGLRAGGGLLGAPGQEAAAGEAAQAGDGDVAVDGVVEQQRLALALLRREADAAGHRGADVAGPQPPAGQPNGAGGRLPGAVDGLEDLRAPRPDEAGQADDLAGADGEADVVEAAAQAQALDLEQRARRWAGLPGAAGRRTRWSARSSA